MYKLKKILLYLRQSYSPDLRALSLLRLGVALVVITDLIIRSGDLTAHYTDSGIWPTRLISTFNGKPGAWSLHALSGSFWWICLLFILHFIASVFLLIGYKSKIASVIVWLLTMSLQNRNTYILQGGDDVLRLLLFWGMFLPWQAHYSVDSKTQALPRANFLGALAYLLLISSIYFFTVNLKWGNDWHKDGSAIYYALSLEQIRLPVFGDWLYQHPGLMKFFTWATFYSELMIPVLILWPAKKGGFRLLAFFLLIILHSGIGLTLYVGLFFIINKVSAIGLLPTFALDWLENHVPFIKSKFRFKAKKATKWRLYLRNSLCTLAIILCLITNSGSLSWFAFELRQELKKPVNFFGLEQYWGMFSPSVLRTDGWYVYYGIDSQGRQYDLYKQQDYVDFSKPEHIVSMYKTDRWRKLAENLQTDNCTFLRPQFGKYILHQWNQQHPDKKMVTLNLYFMEKENLPDYKTSEITKNLFCVCNDN